MFRIFRSTSEKCETQKKEKFLADKQNVQEKVREQVREQYKVVESNAQTAANTWNDLASSTAEWSFDVAQKSLGYSFKLQGQSQQAAQEALNTYRQIFQESFRAWQGCVQGAYEIVSRTTRS